MRFPIAFKLFSAALALTTLSAAPSGAQSATSAIHNATGGTTDCDLASIKAISPAAATINSVEKIVSPVDYCRVDGAVISMKPGPNVNDFVLALPVNFNGRYYMINQGGTSGQLPKVPDNLLKDGFAVAGTDTGNRNEGYSVLTNRAKALDQAYRGSHLVAVATQTISKSYYSVSSMHRYAVGCSGGGRIGLNVATTHPEDFDGTLAGASGSVVDFPAFARNTQYLKLHPEAWISPAQLEQIDRALLAKFDAIDGAADGIIWDPGVVHVDAETLPFLTPAQLAFARLVTSPVLNPDGSAPYQGAIVPGMPATNVGAGAYGWQAYTGAVPPDQWTDATGPAVRNIARAVYQGIFGPDFDYFNDLDINDQNQMDYYLQYHAATRWPRPTGAQLSKAGKFDRKLIIFAQTSDVMAGYLDSVNNYEELVKSVGGLQKAQTFARLFLAPGLTHCGITGSGPKDVEDVLVKALINWVEKGEAPASVIAHRPAVAPADARTFLLCAYPDQARFRGTGDMNDATTWACKKHF
jgi:feruloyl esterase